MTPRARVATFALIGTAVAFVYAPLLGADFVYWDDHALFTHDSAVARFALVDFFTNLSLGGYFPLTRMFFATERALFGLNPAVAHAINVGLHFLNVILVAKVARRSFGLDPRRSFVVAALFAVHPMNVEPVAWVSGGLKDLLCSCFYLAALNAWALGRSHQAWGTAVLAHLAKVSAVTLTPWWILTRVRLGLMLAPVSLGVLGLELAAQKTVAHVAADGATPLAMFARAATALITSVGHYWGPRNLAVYYDRALVKITPLDLALTLATIAVGLYVWRTRGRWRARGGLFFLIALAPTLKFLPFGQDSVFNDRYLYLPGLGLLCLAARACPRRFAWVAVVPFVGFTLLARAQTSAWMSQEALWLNVLDKYPASRKAAGNLTLYYAENGRLDLAEGYAKRSVEEEPGDLGARSNYGVVLTRLGKLDQARDALERAITIAPTDASLLNNLGYVYLKLNDKPKARTVFARALEIAPDFANARAGLARAEGSAP